MLSPFPSSNFTWNFFVSSAFFVDTYYFFFPFPLFCRLLIPFSSYSSSINAPICDPWTITEGWKSWPRIESKFNFQILFYQCQSLEILVASSIILVLEKRYWKYLNILKIEESRTFKLFQVIGIIDWESIIGRCTRDESLGVGQITYASPVIKERASRNDSSDRLEQDFLSDPIQPN